MGPQHRLTVPRFIMIALFRSSAHTLLTRPFALLGPLPAMHFPPQSASLTLAYSPDLDSEIISLKESPPSSLVDQILHYNLSLYKSVYSNMLSGVSESKKEMPKKRSEWCPCEEAANQGMQAASRRQKGTSGFLLETQKEPALLTAFLFLAMWDLLSAFWIQELYDSMLTLFNFGLPSLWKLIHSTKMLITSGPLIRSSGWRCKGDVPLPFCCKVKVSG